jgi:hypothetical protein
MNHAIFQAALMLLTCAGSLCMNVDPSGESRWKKYGVLLGIAASPLWIWSAASHGEWGMAVASTWIWGAYFVGAWRCRYALLFLFRLKKPATGGVFHIPGRLTEISYDGALMARLMHESAVEITFHPDSAREKS